jgi:hypothetical protein
LGGWLLVPIAGLAACDFTVTNPGPVEDDFLFEEEAYAGLVTGAGRNLSLALDNIAYISGAVTRELHPAGSTGTYGISVLQQQGFLLPDGGSGFWNNAQRARWTAEDAVRRMRAPEGLGVAAESSPLVAQALIWAGYANRLMGEIFCEAVIDGGELQPSSVFLTRAEATFTDAMAVATAAGEAELTTAAQAGRAQVRAALGDWTGAVADAQTVVPEFRYLIPYFESESALYNELWEASAGTFRAHTVWNTFYDDYFAQTGDPRVGWVASETQPTGDAAVLHLGRVPWHRQSKYPERSAPINLASGREMRLIEAEALLRSGDWAGAMTLINTLRTETGVEPWEAADAAGAWTHLKRERGIELWLEARRLYDVRRWLADDSPGVTLDVLELADGVMSPSHLEVQATCFPVPDSELQTNPNL